MEEKIRSVERVADSLATYEGGGFLVHRSFPTRSISDFDPFLLLDEMGPSDLKPGEAKGAPDHPHRGFETVTYLLEGGMQHKDSRGHAGKLDPGDVQWMTAGAGVVHSEMPADWILKLGGRMHGFQLWVNLPQRDKMIKPHYQEIPSAKIPVAESQDKRVRVKVIAGEALGQRAAIETRTPIIYLHFALKSGGRMVQPVPQNFNAFAYVVNGEGRFGRQEQAVPTGKVVLFAGDGDHILLENPSSAKDDLNVLLIAGVPLKEPIARYGPFVMNTEEEIRRAIFDYQTGRLGKIDF